MILSCFFENRSGLIITWWRRENIFCESPLFNSLSASRTDRQTNGNAISTSVSETIRKPPLPKAQPALRKKTAKNDFQFGGWNSSSLCDFDQIAVICMLF